MLWVSILVCKPPSQFIEVWLMVHKNVLPISQRDVWLVFAADKLQREEHPFTYFKLLPAMLVSIFTHALLSLHQVEA